MQHATKDTGYEFAGVERIIQETFLPHLLFGKPKSLPPIVETLITMTVNKYNLGLEYMLTSDNKKYLSLIHASSKLIVDVTGKRAFSTANHFLALKEESYN